MDLKNLLEALVEHENTVYLETTTLKWGGEYDGGEHRTHHTAVRVGDHVVTYDYRSVRDLLSVLTLLPSVKIQINGEPLDEIRPSSLKNS